LICRIEEFGKINGIYGWVVSDTILATFAKETAIQMRPQDKGGRWTGVEFLYVLPGTDMQQAEAIAQSLQDYFLTGPINIKNSSIRLSLIVGVASFSQECSGLDQLIQRANQSMLNAAPSALL
jgi:diguanylate cyclase (GGDEF)-like protein